MKLLLFGRIDRNVVFETFEEIGGQQASVVGMKDTAGAIDGEMEVARPIGRE